MSTTTLPVRKYKVRLGKAYFIKEAKPIRVEQTKLPDGTVITEKIAEPAEFEEFNQDDILESTIELDKLFKNKFDPYFVEDRPAANAGRPVGVPEGAAAGAQPVIPRAVEVPTPESFQQAMPQVLDTGDELEEVVTTTPAPEAVVSEMERNNWTEATGQFKEEYHDDYFIWGKGREFMVALRSNPDVPLHKDGKSKASAASFMRHHREKRSK